MFMFVCSFRVGEENQGCRGGYQEAGEKENWTSGKGSQRVEGFTEWSERQGGESVSTQALGCCTWWTEAVAKERRTFAKERRAVARREAAPSTTKASTRYDVKLVWRHLCIWFNAYSYDLLLGSVVVFN